MRSIASAIIRQKCGPYIRHGDTVAFVKKPFLDRYAMAKRIGALASETKSLRTFCTETGVGISTMSKLVNGRAPGVTVEVLLRICATKSVRLEWLVFGTGEIKRRP